jgi:hypothetical protein
MEFSSNDFSYMPLDEKSPIYYIFYSVILGSIEWIGVSLGTKKKKRKPEIKN